MGRASRAKRDRARDRAAEAALLRDAEALAAQSQLKLGMTLEQALEMIEHGAREMARRMTRDGAATRTPWGVAYDPRALHATLQTALLMLSQGEEAVDRRGDAPDLSDRESMQMLLGVIGGAVTAGAAAALYLASSPIPFELARHLRAVENPAQ